MIVEELKSVAERRPFRPFRVRLSNGALYSFNESRELGAAQDYHVVFYFAPDGKVAMLDTDNIVEVIEPER